MVELDGRKCCVGRRVGKEAKLKDEEIHTYTVLRFTANPYDLVQFPSPLTSIGRCLAL